MNRLNSVDKKIPILIVDDFAAMRRIIKNCLKQLGFENVTEAEDGQIALDKLRQEEFKFVVSDWNMPNLMGVDLLRAMRGDPKLGEIPFLMVTAEAQKELVVEAQNEGASNYIVKPLTADVLEMKMETILNPGSK